MSSRIFRIVFSLVLSAGVLTSCSTKIISKGNSSSKETKKVPPGQAKKATGSQSAKPYAPGQQKKKKS